MKIKDILVLSIKNLLSNPVSFIMMFIVVALLSIATMSVGNFCYYYNKNGQSELKDIIKNEGIEITYYKESNGIFSIFEIEDIINKNSNILKEYSFNNINENIKINDILFFPYIENISLIDGNPIVIDGKQWKNQNKNEIWINNDISEAKGINIGDILYLNDVQLNVAGIIKGNQNYMNYTYFNNHIGEFTIYDNHTMDFHEVAKFIKEFNKKNCFVTFYSMSIDMYNSFVKSFNIILIISIFLIFICIALSVSSVVNSYKINMEENNYFIGLLKALGLQNRSFMIFTMCQSFILSILSIFVATCISKILAFTTLSGQLNAVDGLTQTLGGVDYQIGFFILLPVINLFVLMLVLYLCTIRQHKIFAKINVIDIMKEESYEK